MPYATSTTSRSRDSLGQRGIALILVLWAVALLVVVAASFIFEARTEAFLATGVVDKARADAAAEAGLQRAVAGLLQPAEFRWDGNGRIRSLLFAGAKLRIIVQSAHGKIDLNAAPDALIESAVRRVVDAGASNDHPVAGDIADAILDWRDPDQSRRPNGAEDIDYVRMGRNFGSADQAFVSVTELMQVRGINEELFDRLADLFTVYTRSPRINPDSASREVLLSIPGLTESSVDQFIQARALSQTAGAGAARPRLPIELLVPGAGYLTRTQPSIYEILVEARLDSGQVSRRGAVVKLTRNRRQPYQALAWFIESDARFRAFDTGTGESTLR